MSSSHQRRPHKKSRKGCFSCKQKHVKCDEQGPPCGHCVLREVECLYPTPEELEEMANRKRASVVSPRQPGPKSKPRSRTKHGWLSPCHHSPTTVPVIAPAPARAPAAPMLRPSPCEPAPSGGPGANRLLELELMHHWTSRMWRVFYAIPEDQEYLQKLLPRIAMRESYLLDGIFAMAATDLAHQKQGAAATEYLCAALTYSSRASAGFRERLATIDRDNIHVLHYSGLFAAYVNFSMAEGATDVLERFRNYFDMLLGAYNVLLTNVQWAMESPASYRAAVERLLHEPLSVDLLSLDARAAMQRLVAVSQQCRAADEAAGGGGPHHAHGHPHARTPPPACADVAVYRLAVSQVRLCFVVDALGLAQGGFCLSLITMAGADFLRLLQAHDPMALFVLLHFGVLFQRMMRGSAHKWSFGTSGTDLVHHVAEMLEATHLVLLPDARAGLAWCREQVGLPNVPCVPVELPHHMLVSDWPAAPDFAHL